MSEVEVVALKPFGKTPQGEIVHPGDPPFEVSEVRAGELEALGLAKRTGKAKPTPANKMAPEPVNKREPQPIKVSRRSPAKLSGRD